MDPAESWMLTHYHHKSQKPLQSLSALTDREALKIMTALGEKEGEVYRRFKQPQKYLQLRKKTEAWLRQEFVRKGGQPTTPYPHYFSLGPAPWIEEGYNSQSKAIYVPLSAFRPEHISFTYPDSMVSCSLRNKQDKVFYQADYNGQVFTLEEILQIISTFGMPGEAWRTDATRKHDLFIEAQVWREASSIMLVCK
ncbi:MAG: hypothetical protein ACFB16_03975 [Phormidesmis sp.]